jgi:hypothetical protein
MIMRLIVLMMVLVFSGQLLAGHGDLIAQLVASKSTVDSHAIMVETSIKERRPLTGSELEQINEAATQRILLRDQAYAFFSKSFYLVDKRLKKNFTLTDEELKEMMLSLSVAVTLFDTTLYTYYKFHDNPKLRRLLNEKDSSYRREGNTFEKSIEGIFSIKNSKYLQRAINIYDKFYVARRFTFDQVSEANSDLDQKTAHEIIQASYLYNSFKNRKATGVVHSYSTILATRIKISFQAKVDFFNYIANSILYNGSRFFGNVVGGFQKRRGILYRDPKFLSRVTSALKPLDILLEKTPFRLTDNFIPGFWGHAAIYIGTKEDLEELGIWNNELVQQYSKEISKGKFIVEALRDKVQMNTLDHFSDIDDFGLLRMRVELTNAQKSAHILRALSHVGKKYDFSFDVETGDTIVCSELHYRTFVDIKFNTTPYLGRSTISVDQVAEQGKTGMPFEPIIMYINGKEVSPETVQPTFDAVLEPLQFEEIMPVQFDNNVA